MSQSAIFTGNQLRSLFHAPIRVLLAVGIFLVAIGDAAPQLAELRKLHAMSDADLAAKGLNRENEIRRILGVQMYI